jgi:tetratricopeptide (TPR) repeat protein
LICSLLALALYAQPDPLALKSQRAKEAMTAGRFEEAAAAYSDLVRAVPGNPGLVMNLALAYYSAGKYEAAIGQFQAATKLKPDLAPAFFLLGVSWQKLGQPAKAIDALTRALHLDPANRMALLQLADAYLATGAPDRAASYFQKLTDLDPKNAKAWQGLGLSNLALARKAFNKVPEHSAGWYALLARSKAEERQFRTAFYLYRKALEARPDMPGLHTAIAEIYRETGHADWAMAEQARERSGPADPLYQEAVSYGQFALEAFSRLAELPPSPELHELLADAWQIRRRYKQSAQELRNAIALAPGDKRLRAQLGIALWRNRDYNDALPILTEFRGSSADVDFALGDTLLTLGEPEAAIAPLESARRARPELLEAHAALGKAWMRLGDAEKAAAFLSRAAESNADGSIHFQLARALDRLGRVEEAERAMEQFHKLNRQEREMEKVGQTEITPP